MAFDAQTTRRDLKALMDCDMSLDPKRLEREYVAYDIDRLIKCVNIQGLPDTVSQWWLLYQVFCHGCAYVHEYDGDQPEKYAGLYVCPGGMGGEPGPEYRPTKWIGANGPMSWSYEWDLSDGYLIRADSLLIGVLPILRKWARLRAAVDVSIYMGTINTRLMTVLTAADDATAEAARQMLRDIETGKLSCILEDRRGALLAQGMQALPYSNSQGANMMRENVEVRQYLEGLKWADLGLSSAYNMKREAINDDEAALNDSVVRTLWDDLYTNLKEDLEAMGCTVEPAGAWKTVKAQEAEVDAIIEDPTPEDNSEEGGGEDEKDTPES